MRMLVVLCLVLGGMDALGEEMPKENEATKKEKASEQWYGIMAGLSQFYLKDELGSYLRYEGRIPSFAWLSQKQGDKSYRSDFIAFGRGNLSASGTRVKIVYFQVEELYGRYLASYFNDKMRLGIMGGMGVELYVKEYIHPPIHAQLIGDMDFSLRLAISGDYRFDMRHHLRAYIGSTLVSYYLPHASGIVSSREVFANLLTGDLAFWNRFLHFNIGVHYARRLSSSTAFYALYRMDFQRARRYERTAAMFAHNLLMGFALKVK